MEQFLERLKQRKLVQWALAYVAAAFALIQVLDVVAQRFGWPESAERILIIVLAIGFFVALVLAWYHGERGAQRVSGTELLILALLLTIGGAIAWRVAPDASAPAVSAISASVIEKSIAVLPFSDLSPTHDQEYFSDGMAEELLNALAKVKELKVAGRTSSFSFKGKNDDLRAIGRTLGVANILEGSVRKQGDKVRITAQLIRTDNDFHLWSETYDGDLSDVFALQERIARAITEKLAVVLNGDSTQPLVKVATTNPEAYALYLQASGIFNRREGARFPEAIAELEQALKLDPKFARAHARLAAIHSLEPIYVPAATDAARVATEREAALASGLDPTLAEPYAALGAMYGLAGRWTDARIASDRSLALDQTDANVVFWAGVGAINSGYTARGCELLDHVLALDPLLPNALLWRGIHYVYASDLARGETLLRRAADVGLAHVGVGLDMVEAAHAAAVALLEHLESAQTGQISAFIPYSLLRLGESTRALNALQQRSANNNALFMHVIWSPAQRSTRALPEFKTFTQTVGLTQLWDRYGAPDVCKRLAPGDYACD